MARETTVDSGDRWGECERKGNGVAQCCEPRMGIGTREWYKGVRNVESRWGRRVAGWMVGWGLGRRSVAVLILGQVTRVGTIHRRRWGGGGAKSEGLGVSNAGWLARNTPLPVYPTYLSWPG